MCYIFCYVAWAHANGGFVCYASGNLRTQNNFGQYGVYIYEYIYNPDADACVCVSLSLSVS